MGTGDNAAAGNAYGVGIRDYVNGIRKWGQSELSEGACLG